MTEQTMGEWARLSREGAIAWLSEHCGAWVIAEVGITRDGCYHPVLLTSGVLRRAGRTEGRFTAGRGDDDADLDLSELPEDVQAWASGPDYRGLVVELAEGVSLEVGAAKPGSREALLAREEE